MHSLQLPCSLSYVRLIAGSHGGGTPSCGECSEATGRPRAQPLTSRAQVRAGPPLRLRLAIVQPALMGTFPDSLWQVLDRQMGASCPSGGRGRDLLRSLPFWGGDGSQAWEREGSCESAGCASVLDPCSGVREVRPAPALLAGKGEAEI